MDSDTVKKALRFQEQQEKVLSAIRQGMRGVSKQQVGLRTIVYEQISYLIIYRPCSSWPCRPQQILQPCLSPLSVWITCLLLRLPLLSAFHPSVHPDIYQHLSTGREASRALVGLRQGQRRVADYIVELCTLAGESGWNLSERKIKVLGAPSGCCMPPPFMVFTTFFISDPTTSVAAEESMELGGVLCWFSSTTS